MAESSSSSSVTERGTSPRKPAHQEKDEFHQSSIMALPNNPRRLPAEVSDLSHFHFLPIILNYFLTL